MSEIALPVLNQTVPKSKYYIDPDAYAVDFPKLDKIETLYVVWLAGGSCDGCSISVLGATKPSLESLLTGTVPAMPKLVLMHTALSVESGYEYIENIKRCERGEWWPYVVVVEGSVPDEKKAGEGFWIAIGEDETGRPITTVEWIDRLCPGAAATIAIGTCATWGGIPAAENNPTGAMGLMDHLGPDYRSAFGLPVINIPGCAPIGDNFTETVAAVLFFLQGIAPLPEFDELGRPAWLYGETVHRRCGRAGYYEEGVFAEEYGSEKCLVELGCWGPVVQCNMVSRGAINGFGGCMNMGGICIGCTMPGFPDKFSPLYTKPPGSAVSTNSSRVMGKMIRTLRHLTMRDKNRETRWHGRAPSGWAEMKRPPLYERLFYNLYHKMQTRKRKEGVGA